MMDGILLLYQNLHDSLGTGDICEEFCARIINCTLEADRKLTHRTPDWYDKLP